MEWEYHPAFILSTVAGAIEEYDLADLMAGLCPRKVLIVNSLSAKSLVENEERVKSNLSFPLKVYSEKSNPGNFIFISNQNEQETYKQLLSWLK